MRRAWLAALALAACAPAVVPWSGGGLPPQGAADRAIADASELWLASSGLPRPVRERAARTALAQLARIPEDAVSTSFALDARVLGRDARRYLAHRAGPRAVYEADTGRPWPDPESLGAMRACLAQVLSATTTAAVSPCGALGRLVVRAPSSAADPTVDALLARVRASEAAASPIRQATADARVSAAWQLALDVRAAGSSTAAAAAVARAAQAAHAELSRYEPADAAWTLTCALELLDPAQGDVRARLEANAEAGLLPPWLLDGL